MLCVALYWSGENAKRTLSIIGQVVCLLCVFLKRLITSCIEKELIDVIESNCFLLRIVAVQVTQ